MSEPLGDKVARRRKREKIRYIKTYVSLVMLLALLGLVIINFVLKPQIEAKIGASSQGEALEGKSYINILVMGLDSVLGISRADTIAAVQVDFIKGKVEVLSIPRDTLVKLPERGYMDKINASYAYGGVLLTKETVENFLDIGIDRYIKVDFEGFVEIIDALGGVEIDVDQRMYYVDNAAGFKIDLYPGPQVLDGEKAMQYVRYRGGYRADIGRIERQKKFLKASLDRIVQLDTLFKIPRLVKISLNSVETDLSSAEIWRMVGLLRKLREDDVDIEMVPGKPVMIDGISYWKPDLVETTRLVDRHLKGIEISGGEEEVKVRNGGIKVEVLNGSGEEGLAAQVKKELVEKGFQIKYFGNADRFDYQETQVIDRVGKPELAERVAQAIECLKLSQRETKGSPVDVTVILGKDFRNKRRDEFKVRVEVLNGCGIEDLGEKLKERFEEAGFSVIYTGNADSFNYDKTVVIDRAGNLQLAQKVAKTINVSQISQSIDKSDTVDVSVIIGRDLKL